MRPLLIKFVLPLGFALLPVLAGALVVVTLPFEAKRFFLGHVTPLDLVILGLGTALFAIQTVLAYRAMQWKGRGFNERPDPWLNRLSQSSEWFPLLGLIGTVGGILQTFSSIRGSTLPQEIIASYAPAITATGSGLLMAFLNLLPAWIVLVGRGLILGLGEDAKTEGAP
ncbi:MAG: MotA/TolQ/ExbB proton channel family protein [Gemmataceae bacterium]|nr:MotA/TolQ/ExbB proton channel family protein [Gemmataceae bacterium]